MVKKQTPPLSSSHIKNIWIIIIGSLLFFYLLRQAVIPFLLSFALAYILDPVACTLEKCKIKRTPSIFILLFGTLITVFLGGFIIFSLSKNQIENVIKNIPAYSIIIKSWIIPITQKYSFIDTEHLGTLIEDTLKNLGNFPLTVLSSITSYVWQTLSGFADFLITSFSLLIIPVASFYMLRDIEILKEKIKTQIPLLYRDKIVKIASDIDKILKSFIQGQLTVSIILILLYSIGLSLCSTPLWLLISIIAGLFNLIPYMGFIVGFTPAALLTFLQFSSVYSVIAVLAIFIAVMVIEGTIITPKIIGDKLHLHPLTIIFSVFTGGTIFGFLGLILAVPVAATVNVCFNDEWFCSLLKNLVFQKTNEE